ncbi:thiamine-monophosphate kinase [Ferrovum sp. JA12]|uniref:thiamine-phosphate kinase n=1 Tax=Ferrovum sp. JA12 TaxID=1356299 RepID=UPI0007032CEF|nr:thiamine-phosphate kinase [Ferrovum sp. JA12]KRH78151.1 thiamine-monophosphate kinase [Ferrovum sp. JA12]
MPSEFDLIQQYCQRLTAHTDLGVGDDAALMTVRPGHQLAVSTDVLVAGNHFFVDVSPFSLGRKAASVNLSDMAAMGATPRWATLGLSIPGMNEGWLKDFCDGFYQALSEHGVDWVGGDTTRGPLNLAVTIMGEVLSGKGLKRSGAKVDDDIWVSGSVGDAAWGLAFLQGQVELGMEAQQYFRARLDNPTARVELGRSLLSLAHSAIDISDGLLADLNHILVASQVGAILKADQIPVSKLLSEHQLDPSFWQAVLRGGDDYELCFTAPPHHDHTIIELSRKMNLSVTRIGKIVSDAEQRTLLNYPEQGVGQPSWQGFDHFRTLS